MPERSVLSGNVEDSPTMTQHGSFGGMIVGTAAYMAPEQARGKPVDKRADIWAFGVVLCEMLTGERPFEGETTTDILAAVVKEEPDLSKVPDYLRPAVEKCLRKDPRVRWRDIGDVRMALSEAAPGVKVQRPRSGFWITVAALALALVASLVELWHVTRPVPQQVMRLDVDLGPEARFNLGSGVGTAFGPTAIFGPAVIVSPDGERVAFTCAGDNRKLALCTRQLEQTQSIRLAGTEDVHSMIFSPDGQWIGFSAAGKLKKIPVNGGTPITLCDAPNDRGIAWGEGDFLVAALTSRSGLVRVPSSGGTPQALNALTPGETTDRWPQVLAGAKAVVFTAGIQNGNYENADIDVLSLKTGQKKILHHGGYFARYVPSGELLYMHRGTLFAAGMDLGRLEVTGQPIPLLQDIASSSTNGGAQFDVSRSGTLVYRSNRAAGNISIQWLDKAGKLEALSAKEGTYDWLRLSPDGKRLALVIRDGSNSDIWVYDIERGTMSRVTFSGFNGYPVWSPDGEHLAYTSGEGLNLWWTRADGSGQPKQLIQSKDVQVPESFSPDGKNLAFVEVSPDTDSDIWTVPLEGDVDHPEPGKAQPFVRTSAFETQPAFSPDGRWIAYSSSESGAYQVYVRPFPGAGGRSQISNDGGMFPMWSASGHELFYIAADQRIMAASYRAQGDSFVAEKPTVWCDPPQVFLPSASPLGRGNIDVAADGSRFAVLVASGDAAQRPTGQVTFVLNFFEELRARVPR
jgi:serine/threonine-protein kinase